VDFDALAVRVNGESQGQGKLSEHSVKSEARQNSSNRSSFLSISGLDSSQLIAGLAFILLFWEPSPRGETMHLKAYALIAAVLCVLGMSSGPSAQAFFIPFSAPFAERVHAARELVVDWARQNPQPLAQPTTADMQAYVDSQARLNPVDPRIDARIYTALTLLNIEAAQRAPILANPSAFQNNPATDIAILTLWKSLSYQEMIELDHILLTQKLSDGLMQFLIECAINGEAHATYILAHLPEIESRQTALVEARLYEEAQNLGVDSKQSLGKIYLDLATPRGSLNLRIGRLQQIENDAKRADYASAHARVLRMQKAKARFKRLYRLSNRMVHLPMPRDSELGCDQLLAEFAMPKPPTTIGIIPIF
jgi:hypothetical protein